MKWKYYPLAGTDPQARNYILKCLSAGAYDHRLSRVLKARVLDAIGSVVLVAFELLDLEKISDYEFAAFYNGKGLHDTVGSQRLSQMDCPLGGLALFLEDHLHSSKEAIVLCENSYDTRQEYNANWRPRESRVVFFGEEIYHIVTNSNANFQSIETAIRESMDGWSTGVCSFCDNVPETNITSEAFFDAIVARTAHIFAPALDGEGFLIWSLV
jgi:hypothetical protein